jgi:hypothetical protein
LLKFLVIDHGFLLAAISMPAYINWRRSRGSRAPEQRDELTSFQPIELHSLPLAKVAA